MALGVNPGTLGELRGGTSKGLALTNLVQHFPLANARHLTATARNFASSGVVARFAINPYLRILKTTDGLSTAPTDLSVNAQDGDTGTDVVLSSLPTAANGGYLYVGAIRPFAGLDVDMEAGTVNGTASVLSGYYWNGTAWANASITDGTASGGATFAQDGDITWSVPSAWKKTSLMEAGDTRQGYPWLGTPLYWMRFQVSAALDSSTEAENIFPIAPSTEYYELIENETHAQAIERDHHGSIQALMDTGTGNLVLSYARAAGGNF